jgi:hypothetical protein
MVSLFVLIHSPLVGPLTWLPVQQPLAAGGHDVVIPRLKIDGKEFPHYWQQHVHDVIVGIHAQGIQPDHPLVLVGHSGAGVLLPVVAEALENPVTVYIFVDSDLPQPNRSRLDLFDAPDEAQSFRQAAVDGLLPTWTEEHLREAIPDDDLRTRFVAELQPMPLAVYEEAIPVPANWPDAPCAYLLFSPVYNSAAQKARRAGWNYLELPGQHFHMLVQPDTIAQALIDIAVRAASL